MTLEDKDGNTFVVYGLYDLTGKVRFDAMKSDKPVVGDIVVVYGVMTNYNGTKEMKNGWLVQLGEKVLAEEVKPEPNENEVTLDFTNQGYEDKAEVTSLTIDGVTITFDKGTNNIAPKYYDNGAAIRVYGDNTFTISSSKAITKIVFTFDSGEGSNAITSNVGTFTTGTWEGNSSSIVFTVDGTKGHRRLQSIVVTFADSQTEE